MKLWILRARDDLGDSRESNPWEPWFDKTFAFLIRAENEPQARKYAQDNAGNERDYPDAAWLSPRYSTCEEASGSGEPGVVMYYHHHA